MDQLGIQNIISQVLSEINLDQSNTSSSSWEIPLEASAHHVHLCKEDVEKLFGEGHTLTPCKELSQPGQFLAQERITLLGSRGTIKNVAILGPARDKTQVEISLSDAISLGASPPVNMSGDLTGGADIVLVQGINVAEAKGCVIVAQNHIHMTPADATKMGVKNHEVVKVRVSGVRPLTFEHVVVRVDESFQLAMHIDFDEANACGFQKGIKGLLLAGQSPIFSGISAEPVATAGAEKTSHLSGYTGKFIDEKTAEKLCCNKDEQVVIGLKTILTPSARDVFRKYKVSIERR